MSGAIDIINIPCTKVIAKLLTFFSMYIPTNRPEKDAIPPSARNPMVYIILCPLLCWFLSQKSKSPS